MKFENPLIAGVAAAFALFASSVSASGLDADVERALDRLDADTNGQVISRIDRSTGHVSFLRFTPGSLVSTSSIAASPAERTIDILNAYGAALGIADVQSDLVLLNEHTDNLGRSRTRFQQVYQGIPVFGAQLTSHFDVNDEILAISASTFPVENLDTVPAWSMLSASDVARNHVAWNHAADSSSRRKAESDRLDDFQIDDAELVVFRVGLAKGVSGQNHLAYRLEVISSDRTVREWVFVDAHSGKVLDQITMVHEVLDRIISEGEIDDVVWPDPEVTPDPDPDPIPAGWAGGTPEMIAAWQDEIDGARETYNLFASVTEGEWLSYDGASATMRTINNASIQCPNASWNGQTANFCEGTTSDDIVTHEWAHAYTEYTADLIYQWQSGALNESYSDVWGEVADLLNGRGTDSPDTPRTAGSCSVHGQGSSGIDDSYRWLIGEDSPGFGGAIRDMWWPNCYGDPGKVSDSVYWCSEGDNGGVHFNSGVPNHGFALLVDGGVFNGEDITGLGLTKSAHIYWGALLMLVPASDFADHADALEASCASLVDISLPGLSTSSANGGFSGETITEDDCLQVAAANRAVELRDPPEQCGFEILLEPNPPERCLDKGELQSISLTDWEAGLGDWTTGRYAVLDPSSFDTPDWAVVPADPEQLLPDGREGSAAFVPNLSIGNCADDLEAGVLTLQSPVISIPAETQVAHLSINHWMSSESSYDGGNLKLSVNGEPFQQVDNSVFQFSPYNRVLNDDTELNDNPLGGQRAWSGANGGTNSGSWGQSRLDLSGVAGGGDSLEIRFDFGIDSCSGAIGWYVDEVEAYSCSDEFSPLCGNGEMDHIEQCDDGNNIDGDGCSAICEVEEGWQCSAAISGADILDPGFEAGKGGGFWEEASQVFLTPICDENCIVNNRPFGPASGEFWVWFGGAAPRNPYEIASIKQDVIIPSTATELNFQFQLPDCDSESDYMDVRVDGVTLLTIRGDDVLCDQEVYVTKSVDIADYADDQSHEIGFFFEQFTENGSNTNFFVDDVSIPGQPSRCNLLGALFESDPAPGTGLEFGEVLVSSESAEQSIAVSNPGIETLTLSCSLSGDQAASFNVKACPSPISVSGSDSILVTCQPNVVGPLAAQLNVLTNDPLIPAVSYPLTCTGTVTPEQQLRPVPMLQVVPASDPVAIDIMYSTSNGNEETSGISFRVHWDSSQLTFDNLSDLWPTDLVAADDACQSDAANLDGDSKTDCYIAAEWNSAGGSFPGTGNTPTHLFTINFTGSLDNAASTPVNLSGDTLAPGYELDARNAVVEEENVGPQDLFRDGFDMDSQ